MKISTKGRYALRMMVDLSINNNGSYISLKDISARQGISDKYSEQIINQLSKSGLVKSIRGAKGGYMLSKSPAEYTVGDVLRVMEGSLAPVACLDDENNNCERASSCVTLEVWQELNKAINNVVDNITLEDLVNRQKQLTGYDYII